VEETAVRHPSSILVIAACICFFIAVLIGAGVVHTNNIAWTDLGLLFGFAAFIAR
jgi:hypothetical protein